MFAIILIGSIVCAPLAIVYLAARGLLRHLEIQETTTCSEAADDPPDAGDAGVQPLSELNVYQMQRRLRTSVLD